MKLSRKLAEEILDALLATGGDYAEIYFQDERTRSYRRRYGKVDGVSSGRTSGIGLRILMGEKTVYGYTSRIDRQSLLDLAGRLAKGFSGSRVKHVGKLAAKKGKAGRAILVPHDHWSTPEKLAYLEKGEKAAFAYSDAVKDFSGVLLESDEVVEIYNTDGVMTHDERTRTEVAVNVTASDGEQFQQGYESVGLSCGLELLERMDIVSVSRRCAETAVGLLSAPAAPSGEMPVVIGNGFGGVLFHEACGHALEGEAIADGASPFADKLGKAIAPRSSMLSTMVRFQEAGGARTSTMKGQSRQGTSLSRMAF